MLRTFEHRPWGRYTVLEDRPDHKIKRIYVEPGQRLSLQRHQKRDELWMVLSGQAEVTKGDTIYELSEGDYIRIPSTVWHRVKNPGDKTLVFIEIQTGTYFGEDDIERKEDDYGRVEEEDESLA